MEATGEVTEAMEAMEVTATVMDALPMPSPRLKPHQRLPLLLRLPQKLMLTQFSSEVMDAAMVAMEVTVVVMEVTATATDAPLNPRLMLSDSDTVVVTEVTDMEVMEVTDTDTVTVAQLMPSPDTSADMATDMEVTTEVMEVTAVDTATTDKRQLSNIVVIEISKFQKSLFFNNSTFFCDQIKSV
jgi:hypothetical protein